MAFKRTLKPTFTAAVVVNVPNDKGGFDKNTFTGTFKRCSTDELTVLRPLLNEEVVRKTLVGWDLKDEETKQDVDFNEAELEAILQIAPSPNAIATAFWETVTGAKTKN